MAFLERQRAELAPQSLGPAASHEPRMWWKRLSPKLGNTSSWTRSTFGLPLE